MLWHSLEALREFAGPDYESAIVPLDRRKLLSRCNERSARYEVLVQPTAADASSGSVRRRELSAPLFLCGA